MSCKVDNAGVTSCLKSIWNPISDDHFRRRLLLPDSIVNHTIFDWGKRAHDRNQRS